MYNVIFVRILSTNPRQDTKSMKKWEPAIFKFKITFNSYFTGILKYQEQNSWLKSNIILTVTCVLSVYSHLIFSGKRRRTSSLMRWWRILVSPFHTSRPPHACCSLVISTLLSLQLSWRINKWSNWGPPSWICVTEPERIHIVVCGSVCLSGSVFVCVCIFKVATGWCFHLIWSNDC